ncbi:hypothetical protein TNCV_2414831 [Trichonephila clavipes]|nr:hypothetical protein TNCV_2414831 [Trichonephila clavipes]
MHAKHEDISTDKQGHLPSRSSIRFFSGHYRPSYLKPKLSRPEQTRSSPKHYDIQFYEEIRIEIDLQHKNICINKESLMAICPRSQAKNKFKYLRNWHGAEVEGCILHSPCTRDSANKTFGPTDLTTDLLGEIGHQTQAFRS